MLLLFLFPSEPFSLAAIKASIHKAVQEAGGCDAEERKKRIRQLQLRWHPGMRGEWGGGCCHNGRGGGLKGE